MAYSILSIRLLLILLLFAAVPEGCTDSRDPGGEPAGRPVQPEPDQPVDPFEQNTSLARGVNLGNALEAPAEGEWGMTVEEAYLQLISDAGFDAVRIPVRWNAHALAGAPYTIDPEFLDRVDEVVGWVLDRGLMAVLNIHHYDALMEQPAVHEERFLSIWRQIAEHYYDAPDDLLFEVLNEPHGNMTPAIWNRYLARAVGVIRESNPYRTLVVGTAPWGGIGGLEELVVPENDRNIIVTVHYYEPFHFTHQGAGWAGEEADDWLGTTWTATGEETAAVDADFDVVAEWAEEHDRPVFLGEFGAYSAAPLESRETWTAYVRQAAEQRGFSWSYWEFGAGFGIYDRDNQRWRTGLLEALVPESPELE